MKPPIPPLDASSSTQEWWRCPGLIYFISAGVPPVAVKIGMTAQSGNSTLISTIKRRVSQIQSSNHELIKLLGIIYFTEGDYPTRDAEIMERELHLKYSHLQRFKPGYRGGEWFSSSPELLADINLIMTSPGEFNLPEIFTEVI